MPVFSPGGVEGVPKPPKSSTGVSASGGHCSDNTDHPASRMEPWAD